MWRAVGVARPDPAGGLDLRDAGRGFGAAEEGRIDQAELAQLAKCCLVFGKMLRLASDGRGPVEAEPAEIFEDCRLELGPCTGDVDVFDAQQKRAAMGLGKTPVCLLYTSDAADE